MGAIDSVGAYLKSLEPVKIVVPEWDNLEIYAFARTITEDFEISNKLEKLEGDLKLITALIEVAKDADGNPLFTLEDKPKLKRVATLDVLSRVVAELMEAHDNAAKAGN